MGANDINIRIGAKLDGLQRDIKKAQGSLTRFANFAESTGRDLSTRLSLPILGVGAAAVTSFAKFEKLELSLKALAEEGEDTAATFKRLQEIAQLPGISLEQAAKGAAQLRAVGFEGAQAEEILKGLSKAVTLSGEGPEQLGSVVRQLVQMSSKGRILQEDLSVIQENVPSIGIAIQDAFGTNNIEAIRATGVSAQQFTAEIIKAISVNEKFQKVQGGISNEFDNFRQSVTASLAELGKTIAESINLSGILQRLSGFLQRVTKSFSELSPGAKKFIVIAAGVAAAIGPLLLGFSAIIKVGAGVVSAIRLVSGTLLLLATNPIGLVIAGIAGLVIAFKTAYDGSAKFRAIIDGLGAVIKDFATDAIAFLKLPFEAISDFASGDVKGAVSRIRNVLGFEAGKSTGEIFAEAYSKSISESRVSEQLSGRKASGGNTAAPDLNAVFANLPTTAPVTAAAKETAAAVEEIEINFERTRRVTAQLTSGLTSDLQSLTGIVQINATNLQGYTSFIGSYLAQVDLAAEKNSVFGDSFGLLNDKISLTKSALSEAVEQFGANSAEVGFLKEQLLGLNEEFAKTTENQTKLAETAQIFADGITSIGGSIASNGC
jgi:tape measure domain-containing protein